MKNFPIQSHITPGASGDWECFRGTGAMIVACLAAWAVLAAAYSWLF